MLLEILFTRSTPLIEELVKLNCFLIRLEKQPVHGSMQTMLILCLLSGLEKKLGYLGHSILLKHGPN